MPSPFTVDSPVLGSFWPKPAFSPDVPAAKEAPPPAAEPEAPVPPPEVVPPAVIPTIPVTTFQTRVDELTAARYEEKKRADQLQQELVRVQAMLQALEKPAAPAQTQAQIATELTEEAMARQVNLRAAQLVDGQTFDRRCNEAVAEGRKEFGMAEFTASVDLLNSLGVMDRDFVEAALETGVGPRIIHDLGKNPEKALEIAKLSPTRKAVALAKLALVEPKKDSSAPAPINPAVNAAKGKAPSPLDAENSSIADWMAARQKQVLDDLKRRKGLAT